MGNRNTDKIPILSALRKPLESRISVAFSEDNPYNMICYCGVLCEGHGRILESSIKIIKDKGEAK